MQSNNLYDQIDRYVLNAMDAPARTAFERRMEADADLARDVRLTEAIVAGIIRRAEKLHLMARMREAVDARSRSTLQLAFGKVRRLAAMPLRAARSMQRKYIG